MKMGLYDTVDGVWLGTPDGPMLFDGDEEDLNRVREVMVNKQLGYPVGRIRLQAWQPCEIHLRDSVDLKLDAETALTMLEEGR